jgi:hypothetical protein
MLIVIAQETGEKINDADRPTAVEANDLQFEAVVTLQARSVLIAREILCLLKNGFADGALGRWRTLHEVAVVAKFLAVHDKHVSERYLLHRDVQSCKAMCQYKEYQDVANLDPFDDREAHTLTENKERIIQNHGKAMLNDWGWAVPAGLRWLPSGFGQTNQANIMMDETGAATRLSA